MRSKYLAARLSLVALALVPAAACDDVIVDTFGSRGRHFGTVTNQAAALFVHPQTVRYRMGQIREAFGDRLDDPDVVRTLVIALGATPTVST